MVLALRGILIISPFKDTGELYYKSESLPFFNTTLSSSFRPFAIKTKEIDLTPFYTNYYTVLTYDVDDWGSIDKSKFYPKVSTLNPRGHIVPDGNLNSYGGLRFLNVAEELINFYNISKDPTGQVLNKTIDLKRDHRGVVFPFGGPKTYTLPTSEFVSEICLNLLNSYSVPKRELTLDISFDDCIVFSIELGSVATINYSLPLVNRDDVFIIGFGRLDVNKFPRYAGNFQMDKSVGWVVYGIKHDFKNFTTELKLREYGRTEKDSGDFVNPDKSFRTPGVYNPVRQGFFPNPIDAHI